MTTKDTIALQAQLREVLGKKVRFMRRQGLTPANLYGRNISSQSIQVPTKELEDAILQGARTSIITLSVDGRVHQTLLRALERDIISRELIHAEFFIVQMDRPIQTEVPISLVGESPASRLRDVVVTQNLHSILVECLPANIPNAVTVDLSGLTEADQAILISDVTVDPKVVILTDAEQSIVRTSLSRIAAGTAAEAGDLSQGQGRGETGSSTQ